MPMSPTDLKLVCDLVRRGSGIVLDAGKAYLVEARLTMLARRQGYETSDTLLAKLRARDVVAERAVLDAMTTNETSFFRDGKPFEALRQQVMPALIARRAAERRLSIWCAASSTGQEPYAIAMILREHFPELINWQLTFIASDLSRDVLEKAKAGRYTQTDVGRGLPPALLAKYFRKAGADWEVVPELRRMVEFREVNLLGAWPIMPALDLVFLRNVLIYFSLETKQQIFRRLRGAMRPDGYLFLGAAETTLNVDDHFARLPMDESGVYHLAAATMKLAA